MHLMQWQEHKKCSSSSLPKPTKATNLVVKYERKKKGENQQMNTRSRSNRFPHEEERLIRATIDLDLLSLFPQIDVTIMGGMEK
jgi:hypothetical protein